MRKFGKWLRHKIRVIILKQWKTITKIYKCLMYYNIQQKCNKLYTESKTSSKSKRGQTWIGQSPRVLSKIVVD